MSLLCHCLSTYKTYFRLQVASNLGFVLWLAWTILTCEFCSVIAVNCPYMWVLFCDCCELSLHVSSVIAKCMKKAKTIVHDSVWHINCKCTITHSSQSEGWMQKCSIFFIQWHIEPFHFHPLTVYIHS